MQVGADPKRVANALVTIAPSQRSWPRLRIPGNLEREAWPPLDPNTSTIEAQRSRTSNQPVRCPDPRVTCGWFPAWAAVEGTSALGLISLDPIGLVPATIAGARCPTLPD